MHHFPELHHFPDAVFPVQNDSAFCRLFFQHVRDLVHQLGQIKGLSLIHI